MNIFKKFLSFFQGLRGRLILTYTVTTALALLTVELVVLGAAFGIYVFTNNDLDHYLMDVQYTLTPQVIGYFTDESGEGDQLRMDLLAEPDRTGLQAWAETVYASGFASGPPMGLGDSPAAPIDKSYGVYVLDPQGRILAAAPRSDSTNAPGQVYEPPVQEFADGPLRNAANNELWSWMYSELPNNSYLMALPVVNPPGTTNLDLERQVPAVIVVAVEPPTPFYSLLPVVFSGLQIIALTGLVLLAAAAPLGALFGFIMSRGLTRRLANLSQAATAWSEGDFSVQPQDNTRDEIGELGLHLRTMAEHTQNLLESRDELALLQERNRLARDLHDTVKQQTFAALMQLRAAKNLLEKDPENSRQAIDSAETLLKTAQHDLAMIIAELRPAALDAQGLPAALADYLPQWSQNTGIQSELHVQGERSLPLEKEQTLFRLAQEALSNVARHSKATRVDFNLEYNESQVLLQIKDNGQGFESNAPQRAGFGLQSMQQRARSLGGELDIHSTHGLGTLLQVAVPLVTDEEKHE